MALDSGNCAYSLKLKSQFIIINRKLKCFKKEANCEEKKKKKEKRKRLGINPVILSNIE